MKIKRFLMYKRHYTLFDSCDEPNTLGKLYNKIQYFIFSLFFYKHNIAYHPYWVYESDKNITDRLHTHNITFFIMKPVAKMPIIWFSDKSGYISAKLIIDDYFDFLKKVS